MEFNSGDIKLEDNMGNGSEACVACLVAVGRVQPSIRFAIDDAIHRGRQVSISPTFYVRLFRTKVLVEACMYRWALLFAVDRSRYFGPRILNSQMKRWILTRNLAF
jgi:hypothetical protein